jgi:hypothetical protein
MKGEGEMKKALVLMALAMLLAGCAWVEVKHVPKTDKDWENPDGIVFFQAELYLWVTIDKMGNDAKYAYNWVTLPNKEKKYAIRQVPGLGTSELTVSLADGWRLESYTHKAAAKVGDALPSGWENVLALRLGETVQPEDKPFIEPGLYRIVYDKEGLFCGFVKVYPASEDKPPTGCK